MLLLTLAHKITFLTTSNIAPPIWNEEKERKLNSGRYKQFSCTLHYPTGSLNTWASELKALAFKRQEGAQAWGVSPLVNASKRGKRNHIQTSVNIIGTCVTDCVSPAEVWKLHCSTSEHCILPQKYPISLISLCLAQQLASSSSLISSF